MISRITKQAAMIALMIGIVVPVSAMDTQSESTGFFNWKTTAGVTVVVGITALAFYKWLKPVKEVRALSIHDFTKLEEHTIVDEDGFVIVEPASQTAQDQMVAVEGNKHTSVNSKNEIAKNLAEQKAELHKETALVNQEIEQLEREIAQEEAGILRQSKKPAGPKRSQPTRGNPQAQHKNVAFNEVKEAKEPAQPAKKVQGKSYGVSLSALKATQLKKTSGTKTVPAKTGTTKAVAPAKKK